MNAVWLNDSLCVTPASVAGLISLSEDDSYGGSYGLARWVSIVLVSGHREQVWSVGAEIPIGDGGESLKAAVEAVRDKQRAAAEVEMGRLSELLWPSEPPAVDVRSMSIPDMRIYDPELYGLSVCGQLSLEGGSPCDLVEGHDPVPHRYPSVEQQCGELFPDSSGDRCFLRAGHLGYHRSV